MFQSQFSPPLMAAGETPPSTFCADPKLIQGGADQPPAEPRGGHSVIRQGPPPWTVSFSGGSKSCLVADAFLSETAQEKTIEFGGVL